MGQSEWNFRENFPVLQTDAWKKLEKETWLSERPKFEGQQPFGGCRSGERPVLTVKFEGWAFCPHCEFVNLPLR